MINLREFTVFRAVMKAGTTVGAARALGLSQPSVSRLLSDLEGRLKVTLFRREGGRLCATHDAHLLLEEVDRAFQSLNALSDYAGRLSEGSTRPIRFVVSPDLSYRFAPRAVALFESMFPNVPVIIDMSTTNQAAETVANAHADVAVSLLPTDHPGIRVLPLVEVPIVAVMTPSHPLASKTLLTPIDLAGQPLITISRQYPARACIAEAFEQVGAEMHVRIESETNTAACGSAEVGLGIGLVNAFVVKEFGPSTLSIVPFRPLVRCGFGVLLSRSTLPVHIPSMIDCLRTAAREQVGSCALDTYDV